MVSRQSSPPYSGLCLPTSGAEIVTVAAAESENPAREIRKASNSVGLANYVVLCRFNVYYRLPNST